MPLRMFKSFFAKRRAKQISKKHLNTIECAAEGTEWTEPRRTPKEILDRAKRLKKK
jgi:hypothetical protein